MITFSDDSERLKLYRVTIKNDGSVHRRFVGTIRKDSFKIPQILKEKLITTESMEVVEILSLYQISIGQKSTASLAQLFMALRESTDHLNSSGSRKEIGWARRVLEASLADLQRIEKQRGIYGEINNKRVYSAKDNYAINSTKSDSKPRVVDWIDKITKVYKWYFKKYERFPNIFWPTLYSEKMQWRKLFDSSSLYTNLCDKAAVRSYVKECGFENLLIPAFWIGDDPALIPFYELRLPFILKSTHGCRQFVTFDKHTTLGLDEIIDKARGWLNQCHGSKLIEPGYIHIPRQLIIESLLRCRDGGVPAELKIFVFNGVAQFVQYVIYDNNCLSKIAYFSRNWERLSWSGTSDQITGPVAPPERLRDSLSVAEKLCRNMDHCRVDFYLSDEKFFIGELTPYSWSGMHKLSPDEADAIMGSFWKLERPLTRACKALLFSRWGSPE